MARRVSRWESRAAARDWWWLGRCSVCGMSVMLDDDFIRSAGRIAHAECFRLLGRTEPGGGARQAAKGGT